MAVKHILEAALDSDVFGGPHPDSRARVILAQRSEHCVGLLRKLEMSEEGARSAVNKALALYPLALCESPIEKMMMAALVFADWYPFLTIPAAVLQPGQKTPALGDLIIAPEFPLGPYRLDFLIMGHDGKGNQKWVNVECDGAEYHHHNITMAEYQADRERDKFVRWCGIEVIRFRGKEIWDNAADCAEEVALSLKRWRWKEWSRSVDALSA
jgi:very-short-patch-repair endonuclease